MTNRNRNTEEGGLLGLLFGFGIDAISQLIEIDNGRQEQFSWDQSVKSTLTGLGIGLGIGVVFDVIEEDETGLKRYQETQLLRATLRSHDPKDSSIHEFLHRKKDEICDALLEEFHGLAYKPEISGSLGKGTGNIGTADMDIVIPFKRRSFSSLADMYDHTLEALEDAGSDPEIIEVVSGGA